MPRWPNDTRDRMIGASLALFAEHGYAAVTVDDIAERSGVSARTFFRHFPDKEEVLFADDDELLPALLAAILAPSDAATAGAQMTAALDSLAVLLEPQRERLQRRQRIIDSQVSLKGRELAKQARWQQSVMSALVEAGYAPGDADLLAAIGFAVFRRSLHGWLSDAEELSLSERIHASLRRVRSVLDASAPHA